MFFDGANGRASEFGGARNFGPDVELMLSIDSVDAATQ
jgi:hypothetical protein